ncbi:thioredoxin domain-containing protein [Flavobacteriaceae bacterium 14752]|uniref:thioredoxin domain-containing protein n=1 Tax=Mesohalobacter salilacus TaxID=2491711 RepID=UPI000F63C60A|nr:thioredoxin domain-containing protein [Flavobacteriaceae bacterium 14752]
MLKNELSKSSSPYLLQHKNNPVHWLEWSDETLQLAKDQNKCLLISVGYSACHWCHVMAHECFEDDEVAALMNKHFINIKIDREERPDIDQIYMDAAQILTGRGGWPLNAFALPDGRPFYAGTYFPSYNWIKVLQNIAQAYKEQPETLINTASRLTDSIKSVEIFETEDTPKKLSEIELTNSYKSWYAHIDFEKGGVDKASKFPMPVVWESLLEYYAVYKDTQAIKAIDITLSEMLKGGIYDWVGGGFSRYSVDENWFAPHFEKMLYDNAQLVSLYADTFKITQNSNYKKCIKETINFLNSDLKHGNFGYYSALDADSEGEEGLFYTWTFQELKQILNAEEFELNSIFFGLKPHGNWENQRNILAQKVSLKTLADKFQVNVEQIQKDLKKIKAKLNAERNKREKPGLDNKLITAHNAMMVKGFVKAYQALSNETYKDWAVELMQNLIEHSINEDYSVNRLMDKPKPQGFLDDYAFLIEALIYSYEISFEVKYLELAENLTQYSLNNFYDEHQQLFYYTEKSTQLIARKIEFSDNVIPSSNAVMAENLWRLGHLVSNENYIEKAKKMLLKVKPLYKKFSLYFARWHKLNIAILKGQIEVAVTGPKSTQHSKKLQKYYWPYCNFCGGLNENLSQLQHKVNPNQDQIFICQNKTCSNPLTNIKEGIAMLKKQYQ